MAISYAITRGRRRWVDALEKMRKRGTEFYGDPGDPCEVVKYYEDYPVEGERFKKKPHVIAYYSVHASEPEGTQKSHICGEKKCIVVRHYNNDPKLLNIQRYYGCHKVMIDYLKDPENARKAEAWKGRKITMEMIGLKCNHEGPDCFYNHGKLQRNSNGSLVVLK